MNYDFYQILGVARDATSVQLKKAHRKLVLKYHPDKNSSPDAEEHFKEIQHAYEVLIDQARRQEHDRDIARRVGAVHNAECREFARPCQPFDNSAGLFTMHGGGDERVEIPPGEYHMHVSLEELFTGCLHTIVIPICPRQTSRLPYTSVTHLTVVVQISRGRKGGDRMTYLPSGFPSPWSTPGTATFIVVQKPHDRFERHLHDLVFRHTLLDSLASAECMTAVPLIEGGTMALRLAAGEVASGKVIRICGKGMPVFGSPERRGDMLVELNVVPQQTQWNCRIHCTARRKLLFAVCLVAAIGSLAFAVCIWYVSHG